MRIGIKFVAVFSLLVIHAFNAMSQCAPSAPTVNGNNGTGSNSNDWALTGAWSTGSIPGSYDAGTDTYTIPAGLVVQVSASNFDLGSNLIVRGTLYITGKLTVLNTKSITVPSGGLITCCLTNQTSECGSSDKIDFTGGGYTWTGSSPGPFNGPSGISSSGMPVILRYFHAIADQDKITLKWSTTMEQGFEKFEVQRSADGITYNSIGEVYGAGYDLTDVEKDYEFADVSPLLGWNYYRLKAIDIDGSIEYFGVERVNLQGNKQLVLYPNPVSGDAFEVRLNFAPSEAARVRVVNQMGVLVLDSTMPTFEKTLTFNRPLDPGMYTLQYTSADLVQSVKFVVKQ